MKRLLIAATALSLVTGSVAMAQPYDHGRHDNRYDRHDNGNHRGHHWARGQRLPPQYWSRGHYIDYRRHHLRAPPRGYRWVQVDNDYVMVALATGVIASIIANN